MYNYAQINDDGYCVGTSQLSGIISDPSMIRIDGDLINFLGRKYDLENNSWTDEYLQNNNANVMTNGELFQLQLQSDIEYLKILAEINGGM